MNGRCAAERERETTGGNNAMISAFRNSKFAPRAAVLALLFFAPAVLVGIGCGNGQEAAKTAEAAKRVAPVATAIDPEALANLNEDLILAVAAGDTVKMKKLLAAGADVNAKDGLGITALMWAAYHGHTEIVEVLLAAGADANAKDNMDGMTALIKAASNDHTKTVRALIAAGADMNAGDNIGMTALMHAAFHGHTETVKALLAAGADVNAKNIDGATAIMWAEMNGHTETAAVLREAMAAQPQAP